MTEDLTPRHAVRASDAEREAVVTRLQTAMAEGRITVDEFGERAQAAYAATVTDQLAPLLADLPARAADAQVEIVGSRPPARRSTVVGDVRLDARSPLPQRVRTGLGDIRVDLRALRTDAGVVELELTTVVGDVDVVVAEGVDAELDGWTVIGDRKVDLAPVPRLAGTPRIVVRAHALIGDLRLRSLGPGESASGWRALLDRLAQRPRPTGP
ncbi:hypothetical protein JOD57_000984 [Geodermatophilus bullaregiensis]|uniref:DUF1707 SHOCT-like domain-containing protein n=1 Tax=Geodermatophilus bullaregiensis TaxID=1564160 RepID=UPI0019590FB2|nr:DUF1707 domain-containing protein [Geodermatophilus bullaregiensis]MBM7805147.1 hypothetical protein [Geodermatophilus bullaregiensis]